MLGRKGFVAIEDVSIVIPIAVAIILFFSALAWAISTIQKTNADVDLTLKVVDIADIFTGPGVLTDRSFRQSCDSALTLAEGYGFVAYITDPNNPIMIDQSNHRFSSYPGLVCPANPDLTRIPARGKLIIRAFPVPFQDSSGGLPRNDVKLLVVAVWKGA
jgi:hypothetical protein